MVHGVKVVFPESQPSQEELNHLILRLLCHFMVDHLPDKGLPEACESLREFCAYYDSLQPELPRINQSRGIPAQCGERFERPQFSIDEE
jgi:hypothetical protein